MLRAIFRHKRRDAVSGAEWESLFTMDFENHAIEHKLRTGGMGEQGYEINELVGIETLDAQESKHVSVPLKTTSNGGTFLSTITDLSEFNDQFTAFWEATPMKLRESIDACKAAFVEAVYVVADEKKCAEVLAATYLLSDWREYILSPKGKSIRAYGPKTYLQDCRWRDAKESRVAGTNGTVVRPKMKPLIED